MRELHVACGKCGREMVCNGIIEISENKMSIGYSCASCNQDVELVFMEVGEE